ncbi:MAG: hypothetical protein NT038_03615 [Euryarchaeota archaeon]|nr:hypothetical protein [Euryarchaeota archaeon]
MRMKNSRRQLLKTNSSIFSSIGFFDDIKEKYTCGIFIPKRLIPVEYVKKYGIDNLWKYDLPSGWRLLYSVKADDVVILTIILEWLPHKKYERRFHY